jgi:outer membrane receptor protein involved in Fe transport
MKKLLPLCLLLASVALAQDGGKISGTVRDRSTKEVLPGVNVTIRGTKLGGATNTAGAYFILNVTPGVYEVTATLVGYQTVTQRQVEVNVNRTTALNFTLTETGVELGQEVVITAERPDVAREKTSTSEIVRAEEVLLTPGMRDLTDVLTLSSDVVDGHFRGGRENEELYVLAGMGIVNPLYGASAFVPIMSAVEEVEVITSGFGAQYGNAQSGVVNISMKEGKNDRWRGRAEVRGRVPGAKHFGPSVYDEAANPYMQLLNSPEKWLGVDESSSGGARYYSTIGNGFDNKFGGDSVTLSQVAYALWRNQGRRDWNRTYNSTWDFSGDMSIGGPLSENVRLFLAGRSESEWLFLPTPEPDRKTQVMGNIVFDVGRGMSLRASGTYTDEWTNLLRSLRTNGFYSWIWDRAIGTSQGREQTMQLGARFVHALSAATFYEVKLNRLSTEYADGSPILPTTGYSGDWSKLMAYPYTNTPDQFRVGSFDNDFRSEKTRTLSVDGALTSQVTQSHLLHAGAQLNLYTIDVLNRTNLSSSGGERYEIYSATPFELGLYVQDKMEFEGMIANIGLRMDLWNQNAEYFSDLYSPFRVVVNDSTVLYNKTDASTTTTPTLGRLQPRIGISFPVSVSTVFHLNYGSFIQRPSFQYTISSQLPRIGYANMRIGNPRLEAQETNSYDVGVTQGLGEGFTLDFSGYYKDVKNLVELAYFTDMQQSTYSTFINRDYADIRGFRMGLNKRRGAITGSLNYTYGVATGKSSTAFNAPPTYYEKPAEGQPAVVLPSPKDILMDFDRTHNLVIKLGLSAGEDFGPMIFDGYPLSDVVLGITSFIRSGRPYTYDESGLSEINNKRTPTEYTTNLKLSKRIRDLAGLDATFYVEAFNIFNFKRYSYDAVFRSSTLTSGGTLISRNIVKYEREPASLQYYDDFAPFLVDQTFMIYDNEPRSVFLGLILNF